MRPLAYEIVPIPDRIHESFDPCRPEFVVSNRLTGATWTVGGDIASEDFDVEYENNIGAGTAKVTITGKGEHAEAYYISYFNITATKYEDANIVTTDLSARRLIVGGKSVYVFTNAASPQVVTAKRGIYLTDYLVVGGGGGGGSTMAGGGGAGGVTNAAGLVGVYVDKDDTFTLSVGAGGVGCSSVSAKGGNGGKTTFEFGLIDLEVPGGGGGGSRSSTGGLAGASGGGGAPNGAGGAGIDGFGFAGAAGGGNNTGQSGGGGGAGHAGYEKVDGHSGYGGEGISNNITGAWVFYGGGGGGGGAAQALYWKYDAGLGGLGGGGNGGKDVAGENGVDGLGGGGGGGGASGSGVNVTDKPGGNGGAGTVIVALVPADFNIEPIPDQILVSGGCEPVPVVHSGETLLVEGVDYTVSYTDNDKPGIALVTITGINDYVGKSSTIAFKTFVCYFVDDDAAPGGDGSESSPFAAISNAVESAKTAIAAGAQYVEIRVADGTYEETNLVLDDPIIIVGASRDGVEIVDNVAGYRAFTITHADAAVKNLTISGNGYKTNGGTGGHIMMTAGLVSNCVIKDGRAAAQAGNGHGGNIWMSGGRLERCLVTGGTANWGGWTAKAECYGMGLYASGGVIDSCFFKDNRDNNNNGRNYGSVYLTGTATLINCTVTGGYSRYDTASGIYVPGANAKVVNCVAYGNYGGSAGNVYSAASNFGDKNLGRFYYCAGPFTNASCATWTVLTDEDFVNYVTYTGSTQSGKSYNELMAYFASEAYANFDWHQRLSSAIVDGGTTDPSYRPEGSVTLDVDGNERVSGVSIDLGCWEADQSQFECEGRLESYGALENANVVFRAMAYGPAFDVVFRWDYGNGVTNDTRDATHVYAYPAAGYFTVRVSASPDGGSNWTDWYTVPTRLAVAPARMFVDSNCATPAFPYKTRATAATTLGAAVGALTNNVSRNETIIDGVDIVILSGSRSNDTGIFLMTAVTIRGETGNPADAEIVDNVVGSRALTLSHPDAVVSNLTISGSGLRTNGGCGGHVRIFNGLVANCVIKDGRAGDTSKGYGNGGNVWISGGRLERCFVTGGTANSGGFAGQNSFGMGLYASGGIIDSCFFKDNRDDNNDGRNYGSVCLAGAATLINCMVTGGYSRYTEAAGIYVNNANAKVVNCVAYGNYGGKSPVVNTAASNFGDKNLGRYFHCAAAFTNASCATWTVLTDKDFVKYESFTGNTYALLNTYMASGDYATFNWHQKRSSKLVNKGTTDTAYRPADSVTLDLDGNERILNRHIDLGCWEIFRNDGTIYMLR